MHLSNKNLHYDCLLQHLYIHVPTVYHWMEMRTQVKNMGLRGSTIRPLSEDAAAELGAKLLGETIVFLISGECVVLEYTRQSANSQHKQELNETIVSLKPEIADLKLTTETLDAHMRCI